MSTSSAPSFPTEYSQDAYVAWHNVARPEDADLVDKVSELRGRLTAESPAHLEILGQLLTMLAVHTEREVRISTEKLLAGSFRLPTQQFAGKEGVPDDGLFKPVRSIIEKMWRKNATGAEPRVGVANLAEHVTDLVRTSVVAPTLLHAREYAKRLAQWSEFIEGDQPEGAPDFSQITDISVDPEAKLASGYFAYHGLVAFKDGLKVEVQVYSELTSSWRSISHRLYEKARVGTAADVRPGTTDARLASLGHLLHLAECELERLVADYASQMTKT